MYICLPRLHFWGEQYPCRPVGNTAALVPFLQSPHIETEPVGEFVPVQPQPLAECDNSVGGGIVDDPARQGRLAADMVENLAQRRFDFPCEFRAFAGH